MLLAEEFIRRVDAYCRQKLEKLEAGLEFAELGHDALSTGIKLL